MFVVSCLVEYSSSAAKPLNSRLMAVSLTRERKDQGSVAFRANKSVTKDGETEPEQNLPKEPSNLPVDQGWAWMILFGKCYKIYLILCGYVE